MLIGNVQPLEVAARVLKLETLMEVRKAPYNLQGWKILDRWAMNSPERLKALETTGEMVLLSRLLEQQNLEQTILLESLALADEGMMEHEILALREIATEL